MTTRPTSRMSPVIDDTSSGVPVSASTSRPPDGRERRAEQHDERERSERSWSEQHEQHEHGRDAARPSTSSRRAAALDAAWPPISICAPGGSGSVAQRGAHRRLGAAEIAGRRRRGHHERRRAGRRGAARRARAGDRTRRPGRAAARAGRTRSACARARRPSSGSRRDSAGARRSCARGAGSGRPRGRRARSWRSSPTVAASSPRRASCSGSIVERRIGDRALAAVEHVDELGAASRAARPRPRPTRSSARGSSPSTLISIGAGLPARSASTSCSTCTYSKRASGTRRCELVAHAIDHVVGSRRAGGAATSRTMMSPRLCIGRGRRAELGAGAARERRDLGRRAQHGVDRERRCGRSPRARSRRAGRSRSRTRPRPSAAGSRSRACALRDHADAEQHDDDHDRDEPAAARATRSRGRCDRVARRAARACGARSSRASTGISVSAITIDSSTAIASVIASAPRKRAGDAGEQRERREHDDRRDRRADRRPRTCRACRARSPRRAGVALLDAAHDALGDDDRVVDDEPDRDREPAERHQVERDRRTSA